MRRTQCKQRRADYADPPEAAIYKSIRIHDVMRKCYEALALQHAVNTDESADGQKERVCCEIVHKAFECYELIMVKSGRGLTTSSSAMTRVWRGGCDSSRRDAHGAFAAALG
jgi:hypothetical protein